MAEQDNAGKTKHKLKQQFCQCLQFCLGKPPTPWPKKRRPIDKRGQSPRQVLPLPRAALRFLKLRLASIPFTQPGRASNKCNDSLVVHFRRTSLHCIEPSWFTWPVQKKPPPKNKRKHDATAMRFWSGAAPCSRPPGSVQGKICPLVLFASAVHDCMKSLQHQWSQLGKLASWPTAGIKLPTYLLCSGLKLDDASLHRDLR